MTGNESAQCRELPDSLDKLVSERRPLWPHTSMRVGGPARWLAQPETRDDLQSIIGWIQTQHLSYAILGGGTNVLFPDAGYPGVVVLTTKLRGIRIDGTSVTVACGENLSSLASRMSRVGLSGLEWACGIPGTIGGAVAMNAGTRSGDIAAVLRSARVLTSVRVEEWLAERFELGYRTSALLSDHVEGIVLDATFKLRQDAADHCIARERSFQESRHKSQPQGASSGCIFKNPNTGPSAGELLDQAGCKGMRIGAAHVSDQHANFIINEGRNNAADIFTLIAQMKGRVLDQHHISLQQEAIIIEGDSPRRGLSPS